ncbi:MAG TPA: UDP-N-acetylglucosamine 2-epimerase [Phycisphaerae bacterium]|nr:UDP-N-acetylglucosamine 2-epimerase [Phycisphaerae bacterium]
MRKKRLSRRRVAVVTGTRAEFGILEEILRELAGRPSLDPKLIVTGMHLLPKFGHTIDHIRRAGWGVDATVRMQTGRDDAADEAMAVSRGIAGIARALDRLDCEIVLVLGDRIEAFAGACAAAISRRVLAHSHGGDRAPGTIDDALRNAITRLAHVHLVASKDAEDRIRRWGEQPWRIRRVGAPGLDGIRRFREADRAGRRASDLRVRSVLGPLADRPYAVVAQHPLGRSAGRESVVMRNILSAVERCGLAGVIIYPNSDPGHEGIIREIRRIERHDGWRSFRSLMREDYLRIVSRAAVLVGSSSSGIIESASLGVNTVNIGRRQDGRLRCGPGVIDCDESLSAVTGAIRRAMKRPRPRPRQSVYGDGRASERIADVLERLIITPQLLLKELTC